MVAPTVDNKLPTRDGEIILFGAGRALRGRERSGQRVLYVNGIKTPPQTHRATCLRLSELLDVPVWGLYNMTGADWSQELGGIALRAQAMCDAMHRMAAGHRRAASESLSRGGRAISLADSPGAAWAAAEAMFASAGTHAGASAVLETADVGCESGIGAASTTAEAGEWYLDLSESMSDWITSALAPLADDSGVIPRSSRFVQARQLLGGNAATLALFDFLFEQRYVPGQQLRLIFHSQGNLIGSNALAILWWAVRRRLDMFHAYPLASPAPAWPTESGICLHGPYAFREDIVTWLSLGRSHVNPATSRSLGADVSPGVGDQHNVNTYLDQKHQPVIEELRRELGIR